MAQPTFDYDEISDTLYVSFAPGEVATGITLAVWAIPAPTGIPAAAPGASVTA